MNWKDFFYFSARERVGLLVLIVFIVGIFAGKWLFTPGEPELTENNPVRENTIEQQKDIPLVADRDGKPVYSQSAIISKPQKQDKETKTYYRKEEPNRSAYAAPYQKTEKYPEGTVIELNRADTTDLKKIPGIGPSYAKRIVGYRNLLGGYHNPEQLQEVYGMYVELYEKITPYLYIDNTLLRKIEVNKASLDQLKAHPYIDFYQAKAIIEIRKKQGRINNPEELSLLEEFTEEDWERLSPYLGLE